MHKYLLTVLLLPALAVGCGSGGAERMISLSPPAGWGEQIEQLRREIDEDFKTRADSPIHPDDRESFAGLTYWAPDAAYRFVGPIHLHAAPEKLTVITTTGRNRPAEKYGWVEFTVNGTRCKLQVYRMLDQRADDAVKSLFLPFTDRTSGKETYPAGRYVNIKSSGEGKYVVDFNTAYNPYCAYGMPERYVCPVTPAENRLDVRIEAGEKGWKRHAD